MTHTTYRYSQTTSQVAALAVSSLIYQRQAILMTMELYLDDAIEAEVDND